MTHSAFNLPKVPDDERRIRDIARVVEALEGLPLDHAWRVRIEEAKSQRRLRANAYYWGVVVEAISQHTGYEMEEVHEYLCGLRWGWVDKAAPKTPRNPSGVSSRPVRTTTMNEDGQRSVLSIMQFYDFVEFSRRFAEDKCGIVTPDPSSYSEAG